MRLSKTSVFSNRRNCKTQPYRYAKLLSPIPLCLPSDDMETAIERQVVQHVKTLVVAVLDFVNHLNVQIVDVFDEIQYIAGFWRPFRSTVQ